MLSHTHADAHQGYHMSFALLYRGTLEVEETYKEIHKWQKGKPSFVSQGSAWNIGNLQIRTEKNRTYFIQNELRPHVGGIWAYNSNRQTNSM